MHGFAIDSDGAVATDGSVVTIENRAPSLTGTAIVPSVGVTTDTSLSCTSVVSDDDGETPNLIYEWTVGSNIYTGDTLSLDNTMASPGDTILCSVFATDGYGGTVTDTASVTVENSDPVIYSVTITPQANVSSVTLLTCDHTAFDYDGDTPSPSYSWSNLTTGINHASSNTLPYPFGYIANRCCTMWSHGYRYRWWQCSLMI